MRKSLLSTNDDKKIRAKKANEKYKRNNKEKIALLRSEYRKNNTEKIALGRVRYNKKNKEKIKLEKAPAWKRKKAAIVVASKNKKAVVSLASEEMTAQGKEIARIKAIMAVPINPKSTKEYYIMQQFTPRAESNLSAANQETR